MSQSQSNPSTLKVKVILGTDIRRWRYSKDATLSSLNQFIVSSFNLTTFWLQYEDDECDRLTLSSQTDFEDAFDCAINEERKSLKIYVVQGSILNAQKRNNKSNPKPNTESNPNPSKSCSELKATALDFLQNAEIIKLLPDLHRRIFEEIKKCKTAQESAENKENPTHKWDSPGNVERIMRDILANDAKFKPIITHELYTKKLQHLIPHFATKISTHLPILMNFSCESIAAWIPHLTGVLMHGFSTFGHGFGDNGGMSTFFPLMCAFMSQHNGCNNCGDVDEDGNAIHYGVSCDGCNVSPIKGPRFKCCICTNYDLCKTCESFGKHDPNHPTIKFMNAAKCAVPPFMGLHEIMSQFGHSPHKWFGHHWKGRFGGGRHGKCQTGNKGQQSGNNNGFQPHAPPPHMQGQQWWNQDGNNWHRGHHGRRWGHRGYHHQNQWQQHQHQQQSYDQSNPWQQWCDNRSVNDTGSVISSTLSDKGSNPKKVKVMADFVCDVTLPDRSYYPVDTVLTKTWRMKNNGEYEWGNAVELVFFKGNESLTLEKRYPVINAKPGQEVQVSAAIKTPKKPGRYCSYYRLQRNGEYFGPRVWVDIFACDESQNIASLNKKSPKKDKKAKKDKIIKLEKKEAKLEAKQLKLQAKLEKKQTKIENVQKALDSQNENDNSKKLAQKQEKLQKQQNKLQNRVNKLKNKSFENKSNILDEQQLLDDIANLAVKDLEKQMNNHCPLSMADIPLSAISCVCGTTLHKTSPIEAYNSSAQVNCDICGKFCASNSAIYHCPNMKSVAHCEGYDLCSSCVEYQMQGFIPNLDNIAPVIVPIAPVQPKPEPKEESESVFEYAQELEQLRAMNIADDEKIKNELIKQKGNVQRVANRLLQLQ